MHNWFAVETEANFRRHEWERAAAEQARAEALLAELDLPRFHLPHLSLVGLRQLITAPALGFVAPFARRRRGTPRDDRPPACTCTGANASV